MPMNCCRGRMFSNCWNGFARCSRRWWGRWFRNSIGRPAAAGAAESPEGRDFGPDLPLILEALGEHAGRTKNAALLTECARKALSRTITGQYKKADGKLYAITIDPTLEHPLLSCVQQGPEAITLAIPPEAASQINQAAAQCWKSAMDKGLDEVVLLCDARIRPGMMNLIGRSLQRLPVVAYDEVSAGTQVEPVETVSLAEAASVLSQNGEMVTV